jgi:hypothetical protein
MGPHLILLWMVVAQLADAATFAIAVGRVGIQNEANAFAATLYAFGGIDAVLIVKGVAIIAAIAILVVAASRYRRVLVLGGAAATSLGILGFVTNTWALALRF